MIPIWRRSDAMPIAGAIPRCNFRTCPPSSSPTGQRLRNRCRPVGSDMLRYGCDAEASPLSRPPLRPNPVTQDEMDAGSIELF